MGHHGCPKATDFATPDDRFDGRPSVVDASGRWGVDQLLSKLIEVHGEPRYDIAPELLKTRRKI